jgi:hypothetical protein
MKTVHAITRTLESFRRFFSVGDGRARDLTRRTLGRSVAVMDLQSKLENFFSSLLTFRANKLERLSLATLSNLLECKWVRPEPSQD